MPLNDDVWLALSLQAHNSSVYQNTLGVLDGPRTAQAAMVVPPLSDPAMIGREIYHAFAVFEPWGFVMASKAVKLTLNN